MGGGTQIFKRGAYGLLTLAVLLAPAAARAGQPSLLGVRLGGDLRATRLVLDLSARITPEVELAGDRLIVETRASPATAATGSGKGLVSAWSSRAAESGERLDFSLAGPARIAHRFLIPPGQGAPYWRYVVDLEPGTPTQPSARVARRSPDLPLSAREKAVAARTPEPPGTRPSANAEADSAIDRWLADASAMEPSPGDAPMKAGRRLAAAEAASRPGHGARVHKASLKSVAGASRVRKVVVIDAGHGGHDSGALGANHQEKELTLAAALTLKKELEKTGRYKVILTRDSDVFIPLAERVKIARRGGVDLFLSLHADSAGADALPHGASVYTLSDTGVGRAHYVMGHDEWFTKVAARSGQPGVSQILLDLSQRSTRNHSAEFADLLLQALGARGIDILPRGHRDAGYYVLLAPDVPAALLEMGFVTNPEDEARLSEAKTRVRMMEAVAQAIDAYFDQGRPAEPATKGMTTVGVGGLSHPAA